MCVRVEATEPRKAASARTSVLAGCVRTTVLSTVEDGLFQPGWSDRAAKERHDLAAARWSGRRAIRSHAGQPRTAPESTADRAIQESAWSCAFRHSWDVPGMPLKGAPMLP